MGGQVWMVKPDKQAQAANPCLWMQAGVVEFKNCNNFGDCTTCKYDLGMQKKVEQGKQISWQDAMRKREGLERVCRHSLTHRIEKRSCAYDYACFACEFDQFLEDVWSAKTKTLPHEVQTVKGFAEARLLVVGKGLFGEEEELFRLATESGLTVSNHAIRNTQYAIRSTSDIAYLGWVPPETLLSYFAQADVAIYPFDDTLVNRAKCAAKLRDLLAAGVPVVAEAVGQNREYVRHGETGLLVESGDVEAFAGAVARLLEDAPLRKRLGQTAIHDVRERFGWERLVETVERAYGVALR